MPIWVLGLICFVIVYFALGLGRTQKPDTEGVRAAMEAQRKRLEALRLKELRAKDHEFRAADSVFGPRIIDLQHALDRSIESGSALRNQLQADRAELEKGIVVIETAISARDAGDGNSTCSAEVLAFMKDACAKLERQFVKSVIALNRCADNARFAESSLRRETLKLSGWMKERSEAAQARAAELLSEAERTLCEQQRRMASIFADVETQPQGVTGEKVTAGIIKWRQERLEARQLMALEEGGNSGLASGLYLSDDVVWNPLASRPGVLA